MASSTQPHLEVCYTVPQYNYIQTFYADPEIVNKASAVSLTSLDLFFKSKPSTVNNISGSTAPGVLVSICAVENDTPILSKTISASLVKVEHKGVYVFDDASVPTSFVFNKPLRLPTGQTYGIIVTFEDSGYELWTNKQGDAILGTNTPSPGSNLIRDGKLYMSNNSDIFRSLSDVDLKFALRVARYTANSVTRDLLNKDYEFLTINSQTGIFIPGELVHGTVANSAGTISVNAGNNEIVGTGTTFTSLGVGQYITAVSNTTHFQALRIDNVSNTTHLTVDTVPMFSNTTCNYQIAPTGRVYHKNELNDVMYLVDSSANSTVLFAPNQIIQGSLSKARATITSLDIINVDRINYKPTVRTPADGRVSSSFAFAYTPDGGTNYVYSQSNAETVNFNLDTIQDIKDYDAKLLSRSLELTHNGLYSNSTTGVYRKSARFINTLSVTQTGTNIYNSPSIDVGELAVLVYNNRISNAYLTVDANSIPIDSETRPVGGLALARHISSKVTFGVNKFPEDCKVYMTAYRPLGTDIKVYVRLHNSTDSDAADDKAWSPLEYVTSSAQYSSSVNESDFIEYELGLPSYPESAVTIPGRFTSQSANAVLVYTGTDANSYVAVGDGIKLYNELIPTNYQVGIITAANTTTISINDPVSNSNVIGAGFKIDRLKHTDIAFNNAQNSNIVRYYNSSRVEFDKYDSMQVKIVLLSDLTYKSPKVDQIQVLGVSA